MEKKKLLIPMEAETLIDCIQQVMDQSVNSIAEDLDNRELKPKESTNRESITYYRDFIIIHSIRIEKRTKEEIDFLKLIAEGTYGETKES